MVEFKYESSDDVFPNKIVTERMILEAIDHNNCNTRDIYDIYSSVSEKESQYVTFTSYESRIEAKQFIDNAVERFNEGDGANYIINIPEKQYEKPFIRTTSFDPSWDKSIAESGVFLFKEFWGNGYSTERGEAMIELAFNEMDFDYWISKCDPQNKGSIGAIENYVVDNGGEKVGVLPNWVVLDEEYTDILYFKLAREDYEPK
jgi:ribosomal-protein-alanine N-acetyltransferase